MADKIKEMDTPEWKRKVQLEAIGAVVGGEMTPFSPPELRNPGPVNLTSVDEALIVGEARRKTKITR